MADGWQDVLVAYAAYVVASASPGPSNMMIMSVAMRSGRVAALALVAGVLTGSWLWAGLAAAGISTVLAGHADALIALKLIGGLYLLYLAARAARSALSTGSSGAGMTPPDRTDFWRLYRRGLLMHATNPKAILGWAAVMTLGVHAGAAPATLLAVIGGCAVLGIVVFGGYAVLFSHPPIARAYGRIRRGCEATLAVVFGSAGVRMLASAT